MVMRKLGQYEIIDRIDQGGMAEIFRAKLTGPHEFEKIVALKCILPHLSADKEFVAMFTSEARVAAQLQHPNIVQVSDFGCVDDTYYIAMEYIHGMNLSAFLTALKEANLTLSLPETLYIVKQIFAALEYAHFKTDFRGRPMNIVHRDVNPKNVMVSYLGEIKLMDFGIALAATRCFHTMAEGVIKGKMAYLSPEQVQSLPLDHRSDLFSLGIVFYELITEQRPFTSTNEFGILAKIDKAEFVPPKELVPALPDEINRIICKCLTRDREKRYQSAGEILYDCEQFEAKAGIHFTQTDFRNLLETTLGENVVNSPIIPPTDAQDFSEEETFADISSDPALRAFKEKSDSDITSSATLAADVQLGDGKTPSEVRIRHETTPVTRKTPAVGIQGEDFPLSSEVGTGTRSFRDRIRFPLVITFVLLLAALTVVMIAGPKGTLKLLGFGAGEITSNLTVSVNPEDAFVEVDFIEQKGNPIQIPINWELGSKHVISVDHPAYRTQLITLVAPKSEKKLIAVDPSEPGVKLEYKPDGYKLTIEMIPNYIKVPVLSTPSGAKIFVDDIDTGQVTPMEFSFQTDRKSVVRAEKDGYESMRKIFKPDPFREKESLEFKLAAKQPPTPVPVPKGKVVVSSDYPVDIYRGSRRLYKGVTHKTLLLPVGNVKLKLKNAKLLLDVTRTVRVSDDKPVYIQAPRTGKMILNTDPPGSHVFINNTEIGTAPGQFDLAPGLYNVLFKWDLCPETESKWVTIKSGQNKKVNTVIGCR